MDGTMEDDEVVSTFFTCEDSLDHKMINACLEAEDVQFVNETSQSFWELCSFGVNYNQTDNENGENRRLAEQTPDLVLDLPARAPETAAPVDAADTFAHNRDTLKKRPAHKPSSSDSTSAPEPVPEPDPEPSAPAGSPVPARNTARVAAKFADLTLTGGSLKPALAAKPALLRRPTPHPQHAKPQPPPDEAT